MHLGSPWKLQLSLENPWISVLTLSNPKEKEQDLQDKITHVVDWTNKDMGSFLHWMESFKNEKCALENHCKVLEFLFRIGYKPHVCSVIWELLKKGVGERVGDLLNLHCTLYTVHCTLYTVRSILSVRQWKHWFEILKLMFVWYQFQRFQTGQSWPFSRELANWYHQRGFCYWASEFSPQTFPTGRRCYLGN